MITLKTNIRKWIQMKKIKKRIDIIVALSFDLLSFFWKLNSYIWKTFNYAVQNSVLSSNFMFGKPPLTECGNSLFTTHN